MKLLFCPHCQDVFKLTQHKKSCECGKSYGYYDNQLHATVGGDGIPLGFANTSFKVALKNRPWWGLGQEFKAFVIPHYCDTINYGKET